MSEKPRCETDNLLHTFIPLPSSLKMSATMWYWPIKARNVVAELIAAAGGIPITRSQPEWPAFKNETHFGQLPVLTFSDGLKRDCFRGLLSNAANHRILTLKSLLASIST
jgi:hypothetical protein